MSTKDAHTPGPWEPRQNESGMFVTCVNEVHVDSDGDPSDICSIENEGYYGAEQAWANARLIAAAPDLLAALAHMARDAMINPGGMISYEALSKASAALTKAQS